MAAGVVDDHRMERAVLAELAGGERRALVARPRLVDGPAQRNAAFVRHVDRRGRRTPVDGGAPTGVAIGEKVDRPAELAIERRRASFADATI
jgi:hypothetical protein